jgi:hypothetical protein
MPARPEVFEFVIKESFTPSTLPMARLAEYLADLATILGEKERVHFVELREGSTAVRHSVEHEAVPKVRARLHAARVGDADEDVRSAQDRIDRRLREDNASAELRVVGKRESAGRLLFFPGATRELETEYGPITERAQLTGIPISVGGKKALANVNLEDGDKTYYCEASRDIALQIAPLLFNYTIRVDGSGRYCRNADGVWSMKGFRITAFEKLDPRPLDEVVEKLQAITKRVGLDEDIIAKLDELRRA